MKLKKWSNNHNIDAKIEVAKGKKNIKINKRFIFFVKEEYVMTCHEIL